MKSIVRRIKWEFAVLLASLVVAWHRIGKPQGFEVFNGVNPTTFVPPNLLSHDEDPEQKLGSFPFTDGAGGNLVNMKAGYLVKFNATLDGVLGALAADDAVLGGIIVEMADPATITGSVNRSVTVALTGSFDKNTIKYADGSSPLSAAAIQRLRSINIFVDATVPGGAFAP